MIIDLVFASDDLRIRTRSTPAVRHAVDLVRTVLALGGDGHLIVRRSTKRLPAIECDDHYSAREATETLLRYTTNWETGQGLGPLVRRVRRDARLPEHARRELIRRIAPTLVVG